MEQKSENQFITKSEWRDLSTEWESSQEFQKSLRANPAGRFAKIILCNAHLFKHG